MLGLKNLSSKTIFLFTIAILLCIQTSAMEKAFDQNKKDQNERVQKPLSMDQFKQLSVPLASTPANTFPIMFDQPYEKFIINYLFDGKCVARLVQINEMTRFESKDPNNYNFLLQSILKTGALTVATQGNFTLQNPVETHSASFSCKAVKFLDKFSTEKDLTLNASCCNNSGDVTCADILFNGDHFNAMRGSKLTINNSATLSPTKGLFNYGIISCAHDALINTPSLENWGSLEINTLHFDGGNILNTGSFNINDFFLGKCATFDHRGKMNVHNDCIFEKVDKLFTTRSSSWKVGGNWRGNIGHLTLEGNSTVENAVLLNVDSHAILSGPFHTPILYIESEDLITCNYTAQIIAMYYVGLKAKGWMQFEGDIFKTFVPTDAPANPSQKLNTLLEAFPQRGIYLHSEQSGFKKSGNIIENNGTVCLHAKKGLTHTGLTEAGFGVNSLLSMNAASLDFKKESILKSLNAHFNTESSIHHRGMGEVKKQLVINSPETVLDGTIQTENFFATGNNITTTTASCTTTENCSFNAQEKTTLAGDLTASEYLSIISHDIDLEKTSHTSTKNGNLKAIEALTNQGNLNASAALTARANYVKNSGTMTGKSIQINADRLWWNQAAGVVMAEENLTINALASTNTGGWIQANNLAINAAIDLNLLGVYRAKNTNINALVALNAGICIPKIDSLDELVTFDNALKAGEGLLNTFAPTAGVVYMVGKNIVAIYQKGIDHEDGLYHQTKKLVNNAKELYTQEGAGASDWIVLVCEAKNLATSAVQTANATIDAGKAVHHGCQTMRSKMQNINSPETVKTDTTKNNTPERVKDDAAKVPEEPSINWKEVAYKATSSLASTFGPQMNTDALVNVNCGINAGVNNHSRSVCNTNYGVSAYANKSTVQTYTNTNHGISIASDNHVSAKTHTDTGFSAGVNTTVIADEANINGKNKTYNNFVLNVNNASINAEIDAHNTIIHAKKEAHLKEKTKINSHNGTTHIDAETITSQAAIHGNKTHMDANVINLQNGSNICTQGDKNTISLKAYERLEAHDGSNVNGTTVGIDTAHFKGDKGNTVTSTNGTTIQTNHMENAGSIGGNVTLNFTGNSNQLQGIGQVDHLLYQGTLQNNLADKFAQGNSELLRVNQSGSVTIDGGDQDVHFKDEHTMNHTLKVKTKGNAKCDKKLTSTESIDLKPEKDLEVNSLQARNTIDLAGENIKAVSTVKRSGNSKNYEDQLKQVTITAHTINANAKKNIEEKAVKFNAGKGGINMAGKKLTSDAVAREKYSEKHVTNKKGQTIKSTKNNSTTMSVSQYKSEGGININMEDKCDFYGTEFNSKIDPSIHGTNGVYGHAVYDIRERESFSQREESYWLFFTQTTKEHTKSSSSTAKGVSFKGCKNPKITSDKKISMTALTNDGPNITLDAPSVKSHLGQNIKKSSGQWEKANPFWVSGGKPIKEDTTYSPSYKGTINTNGNNIHVEDVAGRKPISVNTTNDHAKLMRKVLNEIHINQPNTYSHPTRAASLVIAMAVTMATSGFGTSAGAIVATSIGCKSAISTAMVTQITASAITSFNVQAVDALLRCNGDFAAAAKEIASTKTFKNMALSSATAGAIAGAGEGLNQFGLPTVKDAHNLGERIVYAGTREAVNAGIKTGANVVAGQDFKDALLQNLKSAGANTVGVACTSQIGDAYAKEKIDPITHKVAHGMVGALEGFVLNGTNGALAGGIGAMVAETVADVFAPKIPTFENLKGLEAELGRPLTQEEFGRALNDHVATYLQDASSVGDAAKFVAVSMALLSNQDVDIAQFTADNAIDNNFLVLAAYGLIALDVAWSAYEVYNAYQDGGPEAAFQQLGIQVLTHGTGIAVGHIGFKIGSKLYPTAKAAITAALEATPGLKLALSKIIDPMVVAGEKFGQSKLGKVITNIETGLVNAEKTAVQKVNQTISNRGANIAEDLVEHVVPNNVISKMEAQSSKQTIQNAVKAESKAVVKPLSNTLKDTYYEVNGFKFTQFYYDKLWNNGRGYPGFRAESILRGATTIVPDPQKYEGFFKYIYNDWEMIFNPTTRVVSHLSPTKKKLI